MFLIDGGATTISAALNGLVIRDGKRPAARGGIYVGIDDTLMLTNATVPATAPASPAAGFTADDDAAITLINVTVSGNSAAPAAAGFAGNNGAAITLINSTVSGNSDTGQDGGGLYSDAGGTLTLINSTVCGNSAVGDGGGIYGFTDNVITLINSTVTGNSADSDGGGIYNVGPNAITTLTNSIVAGNAAAGLGDDLYGSTSTDLMFTGDNIIGSAPVSFVTITGAPSAQIDGTSQADLETVFADVALVDPDGAGGNPAFFAGVLADNGGPVQTVALQRGGIAHNTGDDGVLPADTEDLDGDGNTTELLPVDARGLPRTIGIVDIGAFELLGPPANDFNADLHSDILWREDDTGTVALWEMDGVTVLSNTGVATIPTYWHIVDGNSDFDGDGAATSCGRTMPASWCCGPWTGRTSCRTRSLPARSRTTGTSRTPATSRATAAPTSCGATMPAAWCCGRWTGQPSSTTRWWPTSRRRHRSRTPPTSPATDERHPVARRRRHGAHLGDGRGAVVSDTVVGTVADTRRLDATADFNGDGHCRHPVARRRRHGRDVGDGWGRHHRRHHARHAAGLLVRRRHRRLHGRPATATSCGATPPARSSCGKWTGRPSSTTRRSNTIPTHWQIVA